MGKVHHSCDKADMQGCTDGKATLVFVSPEVCSKER